MMSFPSSASFSPAIVRLPVRLSVRLIACLLDMLYMSYQTSMTYQTGMTYRTSRLLHACIHTYMHVYDIIFSVMFHVKHLYSTL